MAIPYRPIYNSPVAASTNLPVGVSSCRPGGSLVDQGLNPPTATPSVCQARSKGAKMGRRRKGKAVEIKLLIPEKIYFEFEKELTNNFKDKPVYGARSQLVTSLIIRWIEARKKKANPLTLLDQQQPAENSDE